MSSSVPTIFTHPAVPLALAWGRGRGGPSGRLLAAGICASVLPDLDVIAFRLHVPYAAAFGHRGFSHSLLCAAVLAALAALCAPALRAARRESFVFVFLAAASHGVLDAFTNGGLGVAFFWPWSTTRWFAPWRPIEVSPLGLARFLSPRGLAVLASELVWVWLPLFGIAALLRRRRSR